MREPILLVSRVVIQAKREGCREEDMVFRFRCCWNIHRVSPVDGGTTPRMGAVQHIGEGCSK